MLAIIEEADRLASPTRAEPLVLPDIGDSQVRAEFDAIIEAEWPAPPKPVPPCAIGCLPRPQCPTPDGRPQRPATGPDRAPAHAGGRQRGPPEGDNARRPINDQEVTAIA